MEWFKSYSVFHKGTEYQEIISVDIDTLKFGNSVSIGTIGIIVINQNGIIKMLRGDSREFTFKER